MKIVFWTNSFWPRMGGIQTLSLTLMKSLQKRGHQCLVITEQERNALPRYDEFESIPIYRYPFEQAFSLEKNLKSITHILSETKKLLNHFKPDLMHAHVGFGAHLFVLNMMKKRMSIPSLVTVHGLFMDDNDVLLEMYKEVFRRGNQLTTVSKAVLKQVWQHAPEIRHRSSYLYNGLPAPSLQPCTPSFKPPKILCLGRLTEEKGFDVAIGAFHLLKQRIPSAELTIAGTGSDLHLLQKLAQGLGLEKKIHFMGQVEQDHALKLINASSIIVVPSRYESFGLTALEAMQLAKPVIASRVGGLMEILRHQETGLLIPRNDIDALAEAMEYLIHHPKKAIEMGLEARRDALSRFSAESMTDRYEKVYEDIIATKAQQPVYEEQTES